MKKHRLVVVLMICASWPSFSQSTNIGTFFLKNVTKADLLFERFAYHNALEIYLQTIEAHPDDHALREKIATCYSRLHDPVSAERWYRSLATEAGLQGGTKFEYADVLAMNGKYAESIRWLKEYLKEKPGDAIALDKLRFLSDLEKFPAKEHRFMIASFDFNTSESEYGAHYFHDGVVFASSRDTEVFVKHKPSDRLSSDESFLNLYFAEVSVVGDITGLAPFRPREGGTYYHQGPMAFYDNFRKGALTQSNLKNGKPVIDADGKINLGILFAQVSPDGEFEVVAPFPFNSDAFSNAHPSFSPDGKVMYFSSTAPTGYGDSDLYYSVSENGRWNEPVNLGDAVNTRRNESFPYILNDTTLYFSSDGHGSMGGLDLYVSYKRHGKFGEPINLGTPMNTRFDDFSLVCDSLGRVGYIASNRAGGLGQDDIYGYIANYYLLAGHVHEVGGARDKIGGARISAFNSNGDLIDSTRSDSRGYFILDLPFDQDFKIRGEKEGFETLNDLDFSTRGKPFGVDSLVLPLWKQNLFAKGRVFSNETQSTLPGVTVRLHNLTDGTSDTLRLDDGGQYEFLVRPDRKYRMEGTKEGFISNGFNLDTKGLIEGELLNDIVLEEIYIDKEVVLFDFDKDEIKVEAAKQLNEIIRTLKRFPRSIVNVGAHSDSRGTHEYNMMLSKKRAGSTRDYLLSRGIGRSRIHLSWFGEELVLNRCSDGVECPEEEHSRNRRGELKVQKEPVD